MYQISIARMKNALGAITMMLQGVHHEPITRYPNKVPKPKSSRTKEIASSTRVYPVPAPMPSISESSGLFCEANDQAHIRPQLLADIGHIRFQKDIHDDHIRGNDQGLHHHANAAGRPIADE